MVSKLCLKSLIRQGSDTPPFRAGILILSAFLLFSCGGEEEALFPVRGTSASLNGLSREAAEGILDFAKPKKIEYRFGENFYVPALSSLEIEYCFTLPPEPGIKQNYQLVLDSGDNAWALPLDLSFLGIEVPAASGTEDGAPVFHYALPITDSFPGKFSIALVPAGQRIKKAPPSGGKDGLPRFQILSLKIKERWYGFRHGTAEFAANGGAGFAAGGGHFFISPFVFVRQDADSRRSFVIDPPPLSGFESQAGLFPRLAVSLYAGDEAAAESGGRRFRASPHTEHINIPPPLLAPSPGPVVLRGDRIENFRLDYSALPPFPAPVSADPGLILAWPREKWRNSRYGLFRWEQFPSLLIFDTADYGVQDRLFKRLAFFTEKAGFRGRLAPDEEIASMHGWNAHDYRAEDLARFFEAARQTRFPLLPEERELEGILLDTGIIRRDSGGAISGGEGGIISVSRESTGYLRSMFMVHEAFHGLFFIDEDFRAYSRGRWDRLPSGAKRFITSYFDYQHYDIKDEYLMINEFMAHILQQPASGAGRYFGTTLASRIDASSWRRPVLPEKDEAAGSWPLIAETFTREAQSFSGYVNRRWGLSAGRVWRLTVDN